MTVESENVERLMSWFAQDGPGLSCSGGDTLVAALGALVFQGGSDWPQHADRADAYRDGLRAWFANDGARGSRFVALTGPDDEPAAFVAWFLPVLQEWQGWAAHNESGAQVGGEIVGLPNPSSDGTPGTEFYRFDEATGEYLYAATVDSGDWASYQQRRYSEPARDDNYGLDYRLDRTRQVYEWYDEAAGTWQDQTWADLHAARAHGSAAAAPSGEPAPEWDENWAMFYRVGPGGMYEFADAVAPGEQTSGCGGVWLSHEQVLARKAQSAQTGAGQTGVGQLADATLNLSPEEVHAEVQAAVEALLAEEPELRAILSDEEITALAKETAKEIISGQA